MTDMVKHKIAHKSILIALILSSLLSVCIPSVCSEGDDWPMFRHDLSHSGYSTSTAPKTREVKWIYITGDWVESSPAVADGKVYIGSYDNKVYCLNANTGVQIWNFTTGHNIWSSPAIADGRVYIVVLMSNVLRKNSAVDHQTLGAAIDKLITPPKIID